MDPLADNMYISSIFWPQFYVCGVATVESNQVSKDMHYVVSSGVSWMKSDQDFSNDIAKICLSFELNDIVIITCNTLLAALYLSVFM